MSKEKKSNKEVKEKKESIKKEKRNGFTMVELLVAMAILGLLIVMAFPTMRTVQTANTNNKFEQYGKAILSAAKLYVDSYEDDIFSKNISNDTHDIAYTELKAKDLIKDIGVDDADCSGTVVTVIKYDDDYQYCLNMECTKGSKTVYTKKDKNGYCNTIVRAQVKYVYKTKTKEIDVSKGSTNFEVASPEALSLVTDSSADRFVRWSGSDGNLYNSGQKITGPINNQITLTALFNDDSKVRLLINANGGSLASAHGSSIAKSGDFITVNGSKYVHEIYIDGGRGKLSTDGLVNWNNSGYINLVKTGKTIDSSKVWNTKADGTGKSYDQTTQYKATDFCTSECDLTLYANWVPATVKLTYNSEGGSACNPGSITKNYNTKWGTLCTPTRSGYQFLGWYTGKNGTGTKITADSVATDNINVYAHWKVQPIHYVILKYHVNGGSLASAHGSQYKISNSMVLKNGSDVIQKIQYNNNIGSDGLLNWNNSSHLNLTRSRYLIVSGQEWLGSNGKVYNQTTNYKASDFCDATNADCTITLKANWKTPYYDNKGGEYLYLLDAFKGLNNGAGKTTIYLRTNYSDSSGLDAGKTTFNKSDSANYYLNLNGHTLTLTADRIKVKGGKLTIKNGTLVSSHKRSALRVEGGTVNIVAGVTIQSKYATGTEEGTEAIRITGGRINMSGGTVSSGVGANSGYARAIWISGGKFHMTGGTVISNATKASGYGGTGINIEGGDAKVYLESGTIRVIKTGRNRCGVCMNSGNTVVKKGMTIKMEGYVNRGKSQGNIWCGNSGKGCYDDRFTCVKTGASTCAKNTNGHLTQSHSCSSPF